MGGDIGPAVTIPASLAFLDGHPDAAVIVVGQPEVLAAHPQFAALQANPRCQVVAASEVVTMDDPDRDCTAP